MLLAAVSQSSCDCVLYEPRSGSKVENVKQMKQLLDSGVDITQQFTVRHCTLHLCQTPLLTPGQDFKVDTGRVDRKVVYNWVLTKTSKEDVKYSIADDRCWHRCRHRVKKNRKWENYFLCFHNNNEDNFDLFLAKLENVLTLIQKDKKRLSDTCNTFFLTAVEEENTVIVTELEQDSADEFPSHTDLDNRDYLDCKPLSDVPPMNGAISVPPPFYPAPYVPHKPQYSSVEKVTVSDSSERTTEKPPQPLSDSLYIHPDELPPTFNSILKSANGAEPVRQKVAVSPEPVRQKVAVSPERYQSSEVEYVSMGVVKTMDKKDPRQQEAEKLALLLQTAVNNGDRHHSQEYAVGLATMDVQVTVSVHAKPASQDSSDQDFNMKVYIEDKEASGGNITLKVKATDTIRDLKNKMLMKHMFPVEVQTWIIGKRIPPDTETLSKCNIKSAGHTAFLYLISAKSAGLKQEDFQNRAAQNLLAPVVEPPLPAGYQPVPAVGLPAQDTYMQMGRVPEKQSLPTPAIAGQHPAPVAAPVQRAQSTGNQQQMPNIMEFVMPVSNKKTQAQPPPQAEPRDIGEVLERIRLSSPEHEAVQRNAAPDGPPRKADTPGNAQTLPGRLHPANIPAMPAEELENGWACPACTYNNWPTRPGCEVCTHPRPPNYKVPEGYVPTAEEKSRLQHEEFLEQQTRQAEDTRVAQERKQSQQNFENLRVADEQGMIPNTAAFTCPICFEEIEVGHGVVLRECLHSFCKDCLSDAVLFSDDAVLKCPYVDEHYNCDGILQDREVKALVTPEVYEKYLSRSLTTAESQAKNSFHCKTADCRGWCIYEDHVNFFVCPVCRQENCLTCKAIHMGMNCKQYQEDLRIRAKNNRAANQTQTMIKRMVDQGDAMPCPQCQVIVMKKDGCDWIQCSICKTEICWVTKGPRWGPLGNGDISGGCGCRINGVPCHPDCNNCH